MDYKQVLYELKQIEGNNECIDCGSPDPQWASLKYGTFLCSKCFDIHRSLNEDESSSLLSLTIDTWSEDQIKILQLGGNNKANQFFEAQPEYCKDMSIKEKYTSNFAKIYSEKLLKKCEEGYESFSPTSSPTKSNISNDINDTNDTNDTNNTNNDDTDDNSKNSSPHDNNWENIYLYNSDPSVMLDPNLKEFDNITLLRVYRPSKEKNEEFFAKLGRENEMRREDIPPSQGGKYKGFGSKPLRTEPTPENDSLTQIQKSLTTGWNFLASTMNSISENILKPASNAVRDQKIQQNFENYAENVKQSITEKASVAKDHISIAKDHISTTKDQISTAIQNFHEKDESSSTDTDKNSNEPEPYIVIDYDLIENSDNDIFTYTRCDNFLNRNINENIEDNNNDLAQRRNSNYSFTSINECLSRAYSIGSTHSLLNLKIPRSNKNSTNNIGSLLNSPNNPVTPNLLSPNIYSPNVVSPLSPKTDA